MSDTFPGIYKGIVVENVDPEHSLRVLAQVPAVLGDAISNWCEPILPTLYTPRVGEVIWVQFADGDPSQPLYQSRVEVTDEMIVDGGITNVADFSITPRKMMNNHHYLY